MVVALVAGLVLLLTIVLVSYLVLRALKKGARGTTDPTDPEVPAEDAAMNLNRSFAHY